MRELIGRLDVVDDDAASALRVIAHFDGLVDERASGPAMVRAAAALAGCPAAWHDSDSGVTRRVDPAGRPLGPAGWQGGWPRVTLDTGRDGAVWLERSDEPGPLDRLILERLGKALDTTAGPRADTGRVAHAVRVACDPDLTVAERRPAVETLGLAGSVTVWAVRPPSVSLSARRQAAVDGVAVVLLNPLDTAPVLPPSTRVGSAPAVVDDLPRGLAHARIALRLSGFPAVPIGISRYEDLGGLASLAELVTPEQALTAPDVAVLERLLPQHPWLAETVAAVVRHGSMRQAALALHVHHSTLQERLTWLEGRLGFPPLGGPGRERLALALSLWRIARSDAG